MKKFKHLIRLISFHYTFLYSDVPLIRSPSERTKSGLSRKLVLYNSNAKSHRNRWSYIIAMLNHTEIGGLI